MPLNIVSFFLNFARTILAPTVINQQKFSFFLQDQEGTKAGCKPTTTDLIHLSTEEYEHLFDWKRVCKEIKVIQPLFYVRQKDGRLKMQAVWAKSCRGAMVRYILNNQLLTPEELAGFSYEGFEYAPELGEAAFPHFVR